MFMTLLATTFVVSLVVTSFVVLIFDRSIRAILKRIVPDDISYAWTRYMRFAIYVVGIGGGVQVWSLEKYIVQQDPYGEIVTLTSDRWLLELYNTVIGSLQSSAIVLLVFFVFGLIGVVFVRLFESRGARADAAPVVPQPAAPVAVH